MADLSGMGLDPNVEEAGDGFTVVPGGKYQLVIIRDEIKDNKNKNGKVMHVRIQIAKGEHTGVEIMDYWNILHSASETAQNIGQGILKKVCGLCGIEYPPKDTRQLYGKPMTGTIAVEEFESNNADENGNFKILKSNKIKSYSKAETAVAQSQVASTGGTGEWG